MNKNRHASHIERSVRASCSMLQSPGFPPVGAAKRQYPCPMRMGIFVERIATVMLAMSKSAAIRVQRPVRTSVPQTISMTPMKGPITSGAGMPIFANRPAPSAAGYRNF